jgi:hypothetical protein
MSPYDSSLTHCLLIRLSITLTDDHSTRLLILTHTLTDAPLSCLLYIISDSDLLRHSTSPLYLKTSSGYP